MIAVRRATPADLEAVVSLERHNLGVDAWSSGLVSELLAGGVGTCLLALDDGVPVGHAVVQVAGDIADLQRISVRAEHRRGGVASALLAEVVALASAGGADRLLLEVRADNAPALAFYVARGFVEVDRRPRYYADGQDAVIMRLGLVAGCGRLAR